MTGRGAAPDRGGARAPEVGRVVALWRYPVKSMAGEAVEAVDVSWHGLAGDRRWGFVRGGTEGSGFPWLTLRQRPDLWRYRPRFAEPDRPDASPVSVRTPAGHDLDVLDPALAAELGPGARVMKQDRGVFDTFPLALITRQTVAALGARLGTLPNARPGAALDARRFRPNLLIDAPGGGDFPEDAWVGAVLRVGGLRLRVDKRDQRCVVVNVDPETTAADAAVLRAVAEARQACLGVYGTTVRPGRVALGDAVVLDG